MTFMEVSNRYVLLTQFFEEYYTKHDFSNSTKASYKTALYDFIGTVQDLEDRDEILNYLIDRIVKRKLNLYRPPVLAFLEYYYKGNKDKYYYIRDNCPVFKEGSPKYVRETLSKEKMLEMISNMEYEKHKIMSLVMMSTGLRIGDCLRIKKDNIILETFKETPRLKIMLQGKGNKKNLIFITEPLIINLIQDFKLNNDYGSEYLFIQFKLDKKCKYKKISSFRELSFAELNYTHYKVINKCNDIDAPIGCIINPSNINLSNKDFEKHFENDIAKGNIVKYAPIQYEILNDYLLRKYNYEFYLLDLKHSIISMGMKFTDYASHDFKRYFGRVVWDTYHDIELLKLALNHSRVETSMRYLKNSGIQREELDSNIQNKLFN